MSYGITAVNWRTASGSSAILPLLVQALFNTGLFLVCTVGAIAIINVLLISVFRRVREIGTLRAIGASDSYIRSLIYCENMIIAMLAGLIGVSGGYLLSKWMNRADLIITNELIVTILGGSPVLQFDFLPYVAAFSIIAALFLGFAASVYPVETAVRIEPTEAVRRG
jgi:putative ABC transport system permease protein